MPQSLPRLAVSLWSGTTRGLKFSAPPKPKQEIDSPKNMPVIFEIPDDEPTVPSLRIEVTSPRVAQPAQPVEAKSLLQQQPDLLSADPWCSFGASDPFKAHGCGSLLLPIELDLEFSALPPFSTSTLDGFMMSDEPLLSMIGSNVFIN